MNIKLQIFVGAILLFSIGMIGNMVRRRKLELKYALVWFFVGGITLILEIFPQILAWIAGLFGVGAPVNMLFFMGFVFSLIIIFSLSISLSHLSEKVKRLTQEIALLQEEQKKTKPAE